MNNIFSTNAIAFVLKSCKRLAYIIDKLILEHIQKCTIPETSLLLCTRAVTESNDMPYHTSWTENSGVSLCKQAISRNHLCEILRFLCFDKKSDLSQSFEEDKIALFSLMCKRFIENCISCYMHGGFIIVNEQLFHTKCKCPFTQGMASKSDKYG